MGKISIIHPSRSRPELAKKVYDEWMSKAANPENIEYLLSIDVTDPVRHEYGQCFFPDNPLFIPAPHSMIFYAGGLSICFGHNKSAIDAINGAAKEATGDILIVVSDDFSCPKNWDIELLRHIGDRTDFVAKTQDGLQNWLITLPIMDREYYNRFGYIYNPDYNHLFCDTEMTVVGDLLGKTINIPMLFPHKHHTQPGGIPKDEVSKKNDATWAQGQAVFLNRARKVFDLPAELVKGGVKDPTYKLWMAKHGVVV